MVKLRLRGRPERVRDENWGDFSIYWQKIIIFVIDLLKN